MADPGAGDRGVSTDSLEFKRGFERGREFERYVLQSQRLETIRGYVYLAVSIGFFACGWWLNAHSFNHWSVFVSLGIGWIIVMGIVQDLIK